MAEYPPELVDTIVAALDAIPADLRPSTLINRDRARAALDAITARGRAIVELPEPDEDGDFLYGYEGYGGYVFADDEGHVLAKTGHDYGTAERAHSLGLALVAAAAKAKEAQR